MNIEKIEEHREQDAEALLVQEQQLSRLQGRYRGSENPNETNRVLNSINKVTKEENKLQREIKGKIEMTTNNYVQLAQIVPQLSEQLRRLKFYGDSQMNEILLRQIQIYVEQVQEKAKEYTKYKENNFEDNKNLRLKLKEKYEEFEQQKEDTLEDYKQWFSLQRKLDFYETDFQIEREEKDKTK